MLGDSDEECVSFKEIHDMMNAMIDLFTKNQASSTTTSPSTTSNYVLPSLSSYDGSRDDYDDWELAMDKRFAQCRMCDKRKIKNIVSSLTSYSLTWWENLCDSDKPQTWNDMKIIMRETFGPHHIEAHIPIVSRQHDVF